MKKLLGPLLLLAACEPPTTLIFELNFTPEVLDSPVRPTELIISFCPTATGCQRAIDFERQVIAIDKTLDAKETISFSPGAAIVPQELFFEFILLGENALNQDEVIASGALTRTTAAPSYLKRPKVAVGLLPGTSLQAIKDGTIQPNTRVTVQNLSVHGINNTNSTFFAQAAPHNQFPASPFFSGLTLRGDDALIAPLLPGDCRTVSGLLEAGDDQEIELQTDLIVPAVGCVNSDPLPVSVNSLQLSSDPHPLDGVLLRVEDVQIRRCVFDARFFCAFDPFDQVEVEVSDFIFENNNFDATLENIDASNSNVTIVGVGEVFQGNLFLLLPRNLGDIIE